MLIVDIGAGTADRVQEQKPSQLPLSSDESKETHQHADSVSYAALISATEYNDAT